MPEQEGPGYPGDERKRPGSGTKNEAIKTTTMDTLKIIETVQTIFIGADERDWELCGSAFAETVHLDYTSLAGGEPADLPAEKILESWKAFLPKFKATHHQLGNFVVHEESDSATVFFYGTASHYFPNE